MRTFYHDAIPALWLIWLAGLDHLGVPYQTRGSRRRASGCA